MKMPRMLQGEPPQSSEDLLQDQLEQLEVGAPLEACLGDLPAEEAELLQLVAALREVPLPARDRSAAAAQRAELLRRIGRENKQRILPSAWPDRLGIRPLWDWLHPRKALAGAVAGLSLCALIALVVVAILRSPSQDATMVEISPPDSTLAQPVAQEPLATATSRVPLTQRSLAETTLEPTYEAFLALMSASGLEQPSRAALLEPRGLVEIQTDDDSWVVATPRMLIEAGQRVRTGELSSVRLAFYDGSQAQLGPNTEVAVEQLNARPAGGPRVVVLAQRMGETAHDVAPASAGDSRYEVRTPAATGAARGTAFHVRVTPEQLALFDVDDGAVIVTAQDVAVDVVAGQSTTVRLGEPPDEPAFRITGEGEVTQTGPTWIIAGHTFETHEETVIIGDPQVGDWVFVEGRLLPDGTRVADWIALLRRSPANHFTVTGRVDAIGEKEWTIAGQIILVDEETTIDAEIRIGNLVRVAGVILEDGALLAEQIRLLEDTLGPPFSFIGVVQVMGDTTWTISDVIVAIDDETEIDATLAVNDIAEVRGWILEDGTWLARVIERAVYEERAFEFTGIVQSIVSDTWIVSGITFETRDWTEIEPGIEIWDLVRVRGRILEDGTWVAEEIELLDDKPGLTIVFAGTVDDIEPSRWVVSGIPLQVNDETVIVGEIEEGDLVKVTVRILPEGTWLATRIELLDGDDLGLGCVYITAVVVDMGPGWIELPNWPRIDLGGVTVEGELRVGSVILMLVCVDEDENIDIVRIIVIYQPEPGIPPKPEPPPPPPQDQEDKVTVCHKPNGKNPHTITISRSALQAHLNHGDTLGPCEQ